MGRLCGERKAICSMTTFLKRSGAALLSLVLLCVLAMGAGAASSQTVGVKFWKERSDKESMANSGIDADRTVTLTIKNLPASVLTGSDVNKSLTVTCNIQMDLSLLGEINTTARMCIWVK